MYSVDFKDELNDYLFDKNRKITQVHLHSVCKIYQKDKTCKYISLSTMGYVCMKKSPMKKKLDELAKAKKIISQSDNCEGLGENK